MSRKVKKQQVKTQKGGIGKMGKKARLSRILENFSQEEREVLESLGKRKLWDLLEYESDDEILTEQFRGIIPQIKKQLQEQQQEKEEKERARAQKRFRQAFGKGDILEPVEFLVPKHGMFTIPKGVFDLFCESFGFSPNRAYRKVINLFIYFPKRSPLIAINIYIDSYAMECLFTDAFEEYLLLDDPQKNYSTFCGLFSQVVFSYLESIGNKTVRKRADKLDGKLSDCYIYDEQGYLKRVIPAQDQIPGNKFTHVTRETVSFEELRDKELAKLEEVMDQ